MEYRVLARKYRPASFADLIGQDALVRTLTNAIAANRLHHAFLLTGIRGIGKTTTARIIARALNCESGPTATPCGTCSHCTMIAEDRHPDVLEMDAASRTGVDAMRDLIDTVRYAPASARYKVYIIDEVHMLSTSAFNALLKTLEEPPPHVKFIFATTEARKIPVTILSRCQRFDLKRIPEEMLAAHLGRVAEKEGAALSAPALTLLAQAAEGSVRDGLSLLDQAIAHHAQGEVDEAAVRHMLGLGDRTQTLALLSTILVGDASAALGQFRLLYDAGADPMLTLQDLLEFTHFITRIKISPLIANDLSYAEHERREAARLAAQLSMPMLARLWQMLLKAVSEARNAPSPAAAAEMALVRIAYAAELPTPAEAVRAAMSEPAAPPPPRIMASAPAAATARVLAPDATPATEPVVALSSFADAVALLEREREALLASQLRQYASPVKFERGVMEIHMQTSLGREFSLKLAQALTRLTREPWKVLLADQAGGQTLAQEDDARKAALKETVAAHPLIASVMEHFPGAELITVKEE